MPKNRKFSENELVNRSYMATFRAVDKKDDESGSFIEGTPIVFNQATRLQDWWGDEYLEIIDSHALDNADLKDVRLFVNHDTNKIALARTKNGRGTMSFNIDEEGMHINANLDTENNQEARSLYSAVQRGDMDGMSFMFRIKSQEWKDIDTDLPTRVIKEISIVHEVSVVNFPAYPQTSVDARSSEETEYSPLVEARKAYAEETARKNNELLEIEKIKNANRLKV
ncbi:HK97 family phage prohead protease [Priestia megaterium]|uniref:HK97 family phage prohead protease n=1 Tax=Priestia megaterium TaxID=1404 RepID=UPI002E1B2C40|nr:HK97 family phage prohead protease [Priestia megaterium]MED4061697.1 HK97 family phage prohead protease [Priestia megaterium]